MSARDPDAQEGLGDGQAHEGTGEGEAHAAQAQAAQAHAGLGEGQEHEGQTDEGQTDEGPGEAGAARSAEAEVDAALEPLDDLETLPLAEHPARFDAVSQRLQSMLTAANGAGRRGPTDPAPAGMAS